MSDYSDEDLNDFYDSDDAAGIEDFEVCLSSLIA